MCLLQRSLIRHDNSEKAIITARGYPSEEHVVKTQDNYMLGVHRLPRGRSTPHSEGRPSIESIFKQHGIPLSAIRHTISGKASDVRPVVLLYHGLMMCSEVWLCNLEDHNRLATLLADAGYVS